MDKDLEIALKETEFMDGLIIEGNHFKVTQFLSLREHLLDSIDRCKKYSQDAKRWRALLSSQRIRIMGSAGIGSSKYQHVGLEIWSAFLDAPPDESEHGQTVLTEYADMIIKANLEG